MARCGSERDKLHKKFKVTNNRKGISKNLMNVFVNKKPAKDVEVCKSN